MDGEGGPRRRGAAGVGLGPRPLESPVKRSKTCPSPPLSATASFRTKTRNPPRSSTTFRLIHRLSTLSNRLNRPLPPIFPRIAASSVRDTLNLQKKSLKVVFTIVPFLKSGYISRSPPDALGYEFGTAAPLRSVARRDRREESHDDSGAGPALHRRDA